MAISDTALAAVKQYMRVDTDDDDDVISALHQAAVQYLTAAGITEPDDDAELYWLCVWGLTLHYYDHRDDTGSESPFPLGLRPIITQLKAVQLSQET